MWTQTNLPRFLVDTIADQTTDTVRVVKASHPDLVYFAEACPLNGGQKQKVSAYHKAHVMADYLNAAPDYILEQLLPILESYDLPIQEYG